MYILTVFNQAGHPTGVVTTAVRLSEIGITILKPNGFEPTDQEGLTWRNPETSHLATIKQSTPLAPDEASRKIFEMLSA
jgi:hypothetical protein